MNNKGLRQLNYRYSITVVNICKIRTTYIFVNFPDPPSIEGLTSNKTVVNASMALSCNTTGSPKANVSIYKDGKFLVANSGYVELRLNPVLVKHAGWYTCLASNPLGNQTKRTYIDVLCKYYNRTN